MGRYYRINNPKNVCRMAWNPTRRRVLIGTGTVAAGSIAYAATAQNTSATATVDVDGLQIPDAEKILAGEDMTDVRVAVDSQYSWDANVAVTGWNLSLRVGSDTSTADVIATAEPEQDIAKEELSGTETLTGSILGASDFEIAQFNPENGRRSVDVAVILQLEVLRNNDVIAKAQAETFVEVTVSREEITVTADVGGEGTIEFETG